MSTEAQEEMERRLWKATLSFSKSSVGNKPAQVVARLGDLTNLACSPLKQNRSEDTPTA